MFGRPSGCRKRAQDWGGDASLGSIESGNFGSTTRLNGEVLFNARSLLGEGGVGEAALSGRSDRLALDMDPSFSGEDALRFRGTALFGYAENVGETLNNTDSSGFFFFGGEAGHSLSNGPLDIIVGAGGGFTYYEQDLLLPGLHRRCRYHRGVGTRYSLWPAGRTSGAQGRRRLG